MTNENDIRDAPSAADGTPGGATPLVTVITAVRNGAAHLRAALDSVAAQDYPAVEHVVIDAASSDGSREIIAACADRLAWWVSEPDTGIAAAWNKGLRVARGDYISFLNADDAYYPSFLGRSVAAAAGDDNVVVYGATMLTNAQGGEARLSTLSLDMNKIHRGFGFTHPSCLFARGVFERVGCFDENLRIAIDSDFMLRCLNQAVPFRRSEAVVVMRGGGLSDRCWLQGVNEYIDRLVAHGFVRKEDAWRHRAIAPLRLLSMRTGIGPLLRRTAARLGLAAAHR